LTQQKAFCATSLQLENAFSATRLLPEIKFEAGKVFSPTSLQPENAFSATRLLPEIKFDAGRSVFRY